MVGNLLVNTLEIISKLPLPIRSFLAWSWCWSLPIDRSDPQLVPKYTNSQGRDFCCVGKGAKLFIPAVMSTLTSVITLVGRNVSRPNAYSSFLVCNNPIWAWLQGCCILSNNREQQVEALRCLEGIQLSWNKILSRQGKGTIVRSSAFNAHLQGWNPPT